MKEIFQLSLGVNPRSTNCNIFLCDLFYFLDDITVDSYADTASYSAIETKIFVKKETEQFSEILFQYFDFNYMKINSAQSHILFLGNEVNANVDNNTVTSENKNEILGIALDSSLCFEDHINKLCKKGSQELNALPIIPPYMCLGKRKPIMKAFVISQVGYPPLVYMCHGRGLNS